MALIARCPACKTRFKVVPDQLRIADGWVRCGRCAELFDARAHLDSPPDAPESAAPAADPAAAEGNHAPLFAPTTPAAAPPAGSITIHEPSFSASAGDDDDVEPEWLPPAAADETAKADSAAPEGSALSIDAAAARDPIFGPTVPTAIAAGPAPAVRVRADDPPLFARAAAPRRAVPFWNSRALRLAAWPLAILLTLLFLGQWLHAQGNWVAARWPPLTPAVKALCVPFACTVEPYRQLDAIRIEDSNLKALDGSSFRFELSVRNGAAIAVAMPSFELTLSDVGRQVLVRRVISAAELGAPPTLAAHGKFSAARALRVGDGVQPGAIANYQVVAFYP